MIFKAQMIICRLDQPKSRRRLLLTLECGFQRALGPDSGRQTVSCNHAVSSLHIYSPGIWQECYARRRRYLNNKQSKRQAQSNEQVMAKWKRPKFSRKDWTPEYGRTPRHATQLQHRRWAWRRNQDDLSETRGTTVQEEEQTTRNRIRFKKALLSLSHKRYRAR